MAYLSFIPPLWAGIVLIIAVLGLVFRNKLATAIAKINPLLPAKQTLMVIGVVGILAGGIGWIVSTAQDLAGGLTGGTASIIGQRTTAVQKSSLSCRFVDSVAGETEASTANSTDATYSEDSYDEAHYTAYLENRTDTSMATGVILANLTCDRDGNYDMEEAFDCWVESDSFRSDVSTSDTNTYYIIETTNKDSYVDGFPHRQTAQINDNAGATSSSSTERKMIVFADGDAEQKIGIRFTLPGATVFNYLASDKLGGTTPSVRIFCDGQQKGYITIVKQADV